VSGELPFERLRAVFMGVRRLKEDVERLGGEVTVKTSIVLELDDIEGDLGTVDGAWIEGLDKAAIEIAGTPARGEFMRKLAEAWLAADPANKEILRPAWQRLLFRDGVGRFMEG